MIFSDLYKSPKSPFNKLRGATPHALPLSPDYDPDLVSKDKTKQKEAVRRFLLQKIRNDWDFTWPPAAPVPSTSPLPVAVDEIDPAVPAQDEHGVPQENDKLEVTTAPAADDELAPKDEGDEADSESGAETDYSVVSEDRVHFRPRAEWTSDLSDDDEPAPSPSPFRFDSPDAVGSVVQATMMAKRRRRRKALRDEAQWNVGLACFEARRSAWTGAKTVRVKPKPPSPVSPASPRRLFWRSHHRADSTASNGPAPTLSAALSPTTTHASQGTASPPASDPDTRSNASSTTKPTSASTTGLAEPTPLYPVETLLPIPPPLLPPQNGMRASVTPSIYPSLYDKIVVHSLQPSCPVNLGDMVRACVVGWKRDGEWPPKPSVAVAIPPVAPTYAALAVRAHRKTNSSAAAARLEHARNASGAANGPTRRMSFGALLGRVDKEKPAEDRERERRDSQHDDEGKGIRKSLHKVFSLGHGHPATTGE
ncbi:hypothetical protein GQ53DRAFT_758675 [Thozetella sp. PMI_491]|nr:hypothetical protein GQ53DRAFT_758675 [Thozetella sp. PMI_491]